MCIAIHLDSLTLYLSNDLSGSPGYGYISRTLQMSIVETLAEVKKYREKYPTPMEMRCAS